MGVREVGGGVTQLHAGPQPTLFPHRILSHRFFLGPPRLTASSPSSHGQASASVASGLQLWGFPVCIGCQAGPPRALSYISSSSRRYFCHPRLTNRDSELQMMDSFAQVQVRGRLAPASMAFLLPCTVHRPQSSPFSDPTFTGATALFRQARLRVCPGG